MKVLAVTRPKNSLKKSKKLIEDMGFEFYGAPTIDLFPQDSDELDLLKENVKSGKSDFVIFTSKNGTRFFFEELGGNELLDDLKDVRVVSIGPKTGKKLEKYGVENEFPSKYSSSGLVDYLSDEVEGKNVEIARSSHGSEVLLNGLEENGANVNDVALYKIGLPRDVSHIEKLILDTLDDNIDILTFTSRMTFVNLMKVAERIDKKEELVNKLNEIRVGAIGEPTKSKIKEFGVNTVIAPEDYTFEDMLKKVVNVN